MQRQAIRVRGVVLGLAMVAPMVFGLSSALAVHGDPATSSITTAPEVITANGTDTATVTVQLRDQAGQPLATGGDSVVLTIDPPAYALGAVTDNGNGTYTAQVQPALQDGVATITGTIDGTAMVDDATVLFEEPGSGQHSTTATDKTQIVADGTDATKITVTVALPSGADKKAGGDEVLLFAERGDLTDVVHEGDGVYSANLTYYSPTLAAPEDKTVVYAMVNGEPLPASQDRTITFVTGDASPATTTVDHDDADGKLPADGGSTATVRVQLKGSGGHSLSGDNGKRVQLWLSPSDADATVGPARHVANGLFEATFVAGRKTGTVTIQAKLDELADPTDTAVPVTDTASLQLTAQAPLAARSTLDPEAQSVPTDAKAVITVQLRDVNGNPAPEAGRAVTLETSFGAFDGPGAQPASPPALASISGTTDANGRFVARLGSANAGDAIVTGYLTGASAEREQIGKAVRVTFVAGLDVSQSTISLPTSHHANRPANGTAGAVVKVQAKASGGANLGQAGLAVELSATHGAFRKADGTEVSTITGVTNGSGAFEATLYAGTPGTANLSAKISGGTVGGTPPTVIFHASSSLATSTVAAAQQHRNATETVTVTLTAKDAGGATRGFQDENVAFTVSPAGAGTFGSVTYSSNQYQVTFTPVADGASRQVTFGATIEGATVTSTASTSFHAVASAANSSASADRTVVPLHMTPVDNSDEPPSALITVTILDTQNQLRTHPSRDTVTLTSDRADVTPVRATTEENSSLRPYEYKFRVSSTVPGAVRFQPKLGTASVGQPIEVTFQTPTDSTKSTLSRSGGTSQIASGQKVTLTVQAKDAAGNNRTGGGDTVELTASPAPSAGGVELSPVTDHRNGTYTATVTSDASEQVTVSGTINGQSLSGTVSVTFRRPASGAKSATTVSAWPSDKPQNDTFLAGGGSGTVKVTVKDDADNTRSVGGDVIELTASAGGFGASRASMTSTVTLTTAAGAHEVTATYHPPLQSGTVSLAATVNGQPLTNLPVTVLAGAPNASASSISAAPLRITADGVSKSLVTAQLRDQHGNAARLASPNDCSQMTYFRNRGSLVNARQGTAPGECLVDLLSSTSAGTSRVTARYDGTSVPGFVDVVFEPKGGGSASTITANPTSLPADGVSTSAILVQAKTGTGANRTVGGDTVVLSASAGSLGAVTDNGNGTYSAVFTAGSTPATAVISGTVNGIAVTDTAEVVLIGEADAGTTTVQADPESIPADGASVSTITVRAHDVNEVALSAGGDIVQLTTSAGALGGVTDNDDGTYTATLTASTSAGQATVSATINGAPVTDTAVVAFSAVTDASQSSMSASPAAVPADGQSIAMVTVQAVDHSGAARTAGGDDVDVQATAGTLSAVTDKGDGTYTATLTAPTSAGPATVSATIGGQQLPQSATVQFEVATDAAQSTLSTSDDSIPADGEATVVITVQARDHEGASRTGGGDTVVLDTSLGSLGEVTDLGDGTYAATLTAGTVSGTATVSGTIDGDEIGDTVAVALVATSDPAQTTIAAAPSTVRADGESTATVTVTAVDYAGTARTSGGETVTLSATTGSLGAVTDHGDGTYTAVYTAPETTGTATITGTIGGEAIADSAQIALEEATVPGAPREVSAEDGEEQATVTWAPPADDGGQPVTGYQIDVQPAEGVAKPSRPAAAGDTSMVFDGLLPGVDYTFTVLARNANGASTSVTTAAVRPWGAPEAPANVEVDPGDKQLTVTWEAPFDGGRPIDHYTVTVVNMAFSGTVETDGAVLSQVVDGLVNGGSYEVRVRAVNAKELVSEASAPVQAKPATVPGAVSGLSAQPGSQQVTLSWSAPQDDGGETVTAYAVTVNGARVSPDPTGTSVVVSPLSNGTAYSFTVAALNVMGAGPASNPVTATPVAPASGGGGGGGGGAAPPPTTSASPSPSPSPTASASPVPSPTAAAGPLPDAGPVRINGEDRASTAAAVSASHFDPGVPVVYVATTGNYADALAGGPAAAHEGGPVLLVERDSVPGSTTEEIERLSPDRVVVLGGEGAISEPVMQELGDLAAQIDRVSGTDRFATAAAVSRATFPERVSVAYIATGSGFADALSGGAAAARNGGPVLLVGPDGVPDATAAELARLAPRQIVVLGGSAAIPPHVAGELESLTSGQVERLSGPDRYATSAAIAERMFPVAVDTVFVATGENFPDALAAVPAAARENAPLLLVQRDAVPEPVAAQLRRLSPRRIVILGGSGAVSAQTEHTLASFATG